MRSLWRTNLFLRVPPNATSAYWAESERKRADLSGSAASERSALAAAAPFELRPFTAAGSPFDRGTHQKIKLNKIKKGLGNAHQHAVDAVGPQVFAGGLQQPPVSASVVGDVGLHLVVRPFVGQEHPLDARHLRHRTGEELTEPNRSCLTYSVFHCKTTEWGNDGPTGDLLSNQCAS